MSFFLCQLTLEFNFGFTHDIKPLWKQTKLGLIGKFKIEEFKKYRNLNKMWLFGRCRLP